MVNLESKVSLVLEAQVSILKNQWMIMRAIRPHTNDENENERWTTCISEAASTASQIRSILDSEADQFQRSGR
jgi:hypothetical protein